MKPKDRPPRIKDKPAHAVYGSLGVSLLIFLLLPITQWLSFQRDSNIHKITDVYLPPPPPPPPEPPPPEEEEEEEEELELEEQRKLPSLDQLELSLNPSLSGNLGGEFGLPEFEVTDLANMIFELEELDEIPRVISRVSPIYPDTMRRAGLNGRVVLFFIVDENGMVKSARVEETSNPAFSRPALDAVRKWRFRPGIKDGRKVKTKMRQPMAFSLNR